MPLVDGDVEGGLPPLVPGVEVGSGVGQELHDRGLVTEGRMVGGPITVLVLDLKLSATTE